jgi:hypothetical protein
MTEEIRWMVANWPDAPSEEVLFLCKQGEAALVFAPGTQSTMRLNPAILQERAAGGEQPRTMTWLREQVESLKMKPFEGSDHRNREVRAHNLAINCVLALFAAAPETNGSPVVEPREGCL